MVLTALRLLRSVSALLAGAGGVDMVDAPRLPRVNDLAVGSAPQGNLAAATAGELYDMFNRFVRDAFGRGETDEARNLRERNFSPRTYNFDHMEKLERAREMGRAAQAVEQMDFPVPHPDDPRYQTQPRPQQGLDETVLNAARNYIQRNEGFRDAAYPDPVRGERTPTIGFGTTRNRMIDEYLEGQGLDPEAVFTIGGGTRITRQQARDMEDLYLQRSLRTLQTRPDTRWFNDLPVEAQVVMLDMTYNLGSHFTFPRMFRALERGDFNAAADEILDTGPNGYASQVGNRAIRNANRMRALAGD